MPRLKPANADSGLPRPGRLSLIAPQLMPLELPRADHVDAELLHHVAADFGDGDLQRHLVVADDLQQVDDLADAALRSGLSMATPPSALAAGRGLRILAGRRFAAASRRCWRGRRARLASSGVSTVPVSTTLSLSSSTLMSDVGMKRLSIPRGRRRRARRRDRG